MEFPQRWREVVQPWVYGIEQNNMYNKWVSQHTTTYQMPTEGSSSSSTWPKYWRDPRRSPDHLQACSICKTTPSNRIKKGETFSQSQPQLKWHTIKLNKTKTHPIGYMTKIPNTVPQNPSIPIKSNGGAGISIFITCSSNTNCTACTNAPAIKRQTPINVCEEVTWPLAPPSSSSSASKFPLVAKSAVAPTTTTLTTLKNTPTQWNFC